MFATLGFIVAGIASIVDGVASGIVSSLNTCCHATKDTQTCYGHQSAAWTNTTYGYSTKLSALGYDAYITNSDLACVDDTVTTGTLTFVYYYDGTTDGNKILVDYKNYLKAASGLDIALCIVTFVLAVITYIVLCCPQSIGETNTEHQVVVIPAPPAVASAPLYYSGPQPGMVPQSKTVAQIRF